MKRKNNAKDDYNLLSEWSMFKQIRGDGVGIKDWLAKNVAGVYAYGEVMGRECVKNGLALGRYLYLGHGISTTPLDRFVFENGQEMQSNGLGLYCKDPLSRPAMEDSSTLSLQTRAAGVAIAVQSSLAAASNFMRSDANRRDFNRSSGAASKSALSDLNSGVTIEHVLYFLNLPTASGVSKVLTLDKPGTSDLLGVYLEELGKKAGNGYVGFQRTGELGFDLIAVPLVRETVEKTRAACENFRW